MIKKIDKKIILIKEINPELPEFVEYRSAPKRPNSLSCDIHRATIKGEEWIIFVGLLNGDPFEIFGGLSDTIEIPKKYKEGRIMKRSMKSGGKYDLCLGEGEDELRIKDIVKVFDNPDYSSFTRLLSLSMRHGAPIVYIVEQLLRDREANMFSFSKVMARVLKKYIIDGVKRDRACESCGSPEMAYQEGCLTCLSCGYALCG